MTRATRRLGSRLVSWVLGLAAVALIGVPIGEGGPPDPDTAPMVVDLHVDLPWQVHFKKRSDDLSEGHVRTETLRAGGYGGIVLPIYLPDYLHPDGAHVEDAEAVYETIQRVVGKNPIFLPLLSTRAQPNRVATWLGIEGAGAFAADPKQLDRFIARGVRLVGPVHGKNGPLASSATGEAVGHGLTAAGKALADRVYAQGALVDVSHLSDAAFDDVVVAAKQHRAPVVATHSNARAIAPHPRNLTDAQLRAIAASGGVAGLNFHGPFVTKGGDATVADVIKQVDHMVAVAGIDHVALGSDFDGGIRPAKGLEDAAGLAALARALKRRGMKHDEVLKIFSLNALRVLAWRPPR